MEKIKDLRKERGLTQEELAEKMGLKYYNIGDWERGKCEPCVSDLKQLAEIFDVTVDYLVGRTDEFGATLPKTGATFQGQTAQSTNVATIGATLMKKVGEYLKFNREQANKSVYDIENDLGISHQNQYNWEKGAREPSIMQCVKLADYYGITLNELIGLTDEPRNTVSNCANGPSQTTMGATLTEKETELLQAFNALGIFEQDSILVQIKALAEKKQAIKK